MQHTDQQLASWASAPHLSPERLAAFDLDPFTDAELGHLSACAACRGERDAVMTVVAMGRQLGAEEVPAGLPRLVEWDAIAAGLRTADDGTSEGAGRAAMGAVEPRSRSTRRRAVTLPPWRRAAAALLLVAGGAFLGRMSASGSTVPTARAVADAAEVVGAAVRPVSLDLYGAGDFGTVNDALAVLNRAQRDYERASLWLAANDTTAHDSDVFRARLAALDQMMAASRAALRDAPQDPVLNHYYLAAYSAREATLQALGGALPVDKVIERY
jgi:hypothetical protein